MFELSTVPEYAKSLARFEAWWQGEIVDRTPVSPWVPPKRACTWPAKAYPRVRDRWFDAQEIVDQAAAQLDCGQYVGDSFPVFWPNLGPEVLASLLGVELEYSEGTSWSVPIVKSPEQWSHVIGKPLNFDNPYWRTIEQMTDYALASAGDRFVVGITDLHGNYDLLASLRDPQHLCTDIMDAPALVTQAGRDLTRVFNAAFQRSWDQIRPSGMPCVSWTNYLSAGPAYLPSCDFWCMLSPKVARDLVLPDIVAEMPLLEHSLFHLDGPGALPHLDLLLDLPQLNGIQWVYGAGRGPAAKWVEVYRRIKAAGKCLQLCAENPADALTVLRAIGPKGVWVCPGGFASVAEAAAFIAEVAKLKEPAKTSRRRAPAQTAKTAKARTRKQ